MLQFLRKKFLPYIWLVILHILLLIPMAGSKEQELTFVPQLDKMVHTGLYAILTALWTLMIYQNKSLNKQQKTNWTIVLVILAIGDGIAIEFLQKTPWIHRDFDWFDAVADGIGAISGIFIGKYFHRKLSA
ncbi:VanZ family protein [Flavihumibacter fluvii]|uniref:VanZ family protein n=1 Tax=Flavihumibacter fluvii TaxID=2838157 RepID=UPI001BDE2C7F|nr:VanZ family protein [Flavihumibacter fluvii]ULQ51203.1 VanZ family protein [Flavihumibacter fluvii]